MIRSCSPLPTSPHYSRMPTRPIAWYLWDAGDIDDETAAISWTWIAATSGHPALCETPDMLYSGSETAWLDRRAEKISEERGWPLPIARSEAAAEMVRVRTRKPAPLLPFRT
jgi:hypothetical protein